MATVRRLSSKWIGIDPVELGHRLGDFARARRAGSSISLSSTTCMPICSASACTSCSSVTRPISSAILPSSVARLLLLLFEQHLRAARR